MARCATLLRRYYATPCRYAIMASCHVATPRFSPYDYLLRTFRAAMIACRFTPLMAEFFMLPPYALSCYDAIAYLIITLRRHYYVYADY